MRLGATGKFISVEGIEGVGKSTQIRELSRMLAAERIPHTVTREPGGTPLAEIIRDVVLTARDEHLPDSAELLLMFAARAVHLCNLIEPRLEAGEWVLCDRFTDATYAYQGAGRGLNEDRIRMLETFVQGERRPDLTLLLDAPVAVGLARSRRRNAGTGRRDDRFEAERADFFERVRAAYLARAGAEPARFAVIDASESPEQVSAQLRAVLKARQWIS